MWVINIESWVGRGGSEVWGSIGKFGVAIVAGFVVIINGLESINFRHSILC